MIRFKDLKAIIVRNCRTLDNKTDPMDINSRFNFFINVDKLEKALNNKSDLHVVAFSQNIVSRIPEINELQLISEYIQKSEEINTIFDGKTQIATFMLYCDKEGTMKVGNGQDELTPKQVSDAINTENPDKELATTLTQDFPMYRAVVVRIFDKKKDKFVYSIYFRSSYNMITYISDLKSNGDFDSIEKDTKDSTISEFTEENE